MTYGEDTLYAKGCNCALCEKVKQIIKSHQSFLSGGWADPRRLPFELGTDFISRVPDGFLVWPEDHATLAAGSLWDLNGANKHCMTPEYKAALLTLCSDKLRDSEYYYTKLNLGITRGDFRRFISALHMPIEKIVSHDDHYIVTIDMGMTYGMPKFKVMKSEVEEWMQRGSEANE